MEQVKLEIVSFHFGLPEPALLARVKAAGCRVMASATTVAEARWLEERGADVIIAQGCEAGGHRGMFLAGNLDEEAASQPSTLALVPQIADAVDVPIVAAGGIADGRGIAAAFALGAAGVQIGTAYLFCPEAAISPLYREALRQARADTTVLTEVFTGRPARALANRLTRELRELHGMTPDFPTPMLALAPLRRKAEQQGSRAGLDPDALPRITGWLGHNATALRQGVVDVVQLFEPLKHLSANAIKAPGSGYFCE